MLRLSLGRGGRTIGWSKAVRRLIATMPGRPLTEFWPAELH
ncbi:MAG: hypothetical protein WBF18_07380 [Solirubrobacterales bacterium]